MQSNLVECEYHGSVWAGTGYSEASRNAIMALNSIGVRVKVDPTGFAKGTIEIRDHKITIRKHQVNHALKFPLEFKELIEKLRYIPVAETSPLIIHAPSPIFPNYTNTKRKVIGYTAWETAAMPKAWVLGCNAADEVWIPSFHNQRVVTHAGVRTPVYVIPHAIDSNRFAPSPMRLNGTFTFVSVFRWGLRKGWPELFTAYERAFKDDEPVILRVLTNFRSDEHAAEARKIIDHFNVVGKPRVEILPAEFVPYDFIPLVYQNADVFVLPSRGEGFCLPCAEAMSCGLPAIVTNSSAFPDYVDEINGWPVGFKVERAEDETDPDRDATIWTVADVDDLTEKIKYSFEHQGEVKQKGIVARETITEKFNFEAVARLMKERIEANV